MSAETATIREWLLDEARALQRKQDETKNRLEALRAILRLVSKYESSDLPSPEPTP